MTTPAGKIQLQIRAFCMKQNWYCNKIISASGNGLPDMAIVINSETYWIEVKAGKDTVSPIQQFVIDIINTCEKRAIKVKSFNDFIQQFTELGLIKENNLKKNLTNEKGRDSISCPIVEK
ncbi:hypothetical protein EOM86_04785 [Candidatus Nomurabacteria bacterium]|nr:hypothetical protein [Candidatus Nomurabacteria bacterium]